MDDKLFMVETDNDWLSKQTEKHAAALRLLNWPQRGTWT